MAEIFANYTEIFDHFPDDVVRDRYRFLYDRLKAYIEERDFSSKLYINETLLQQTVIDYFREIYWEKKSSPTGNVGAEMSSACMAYWITRRKPLQICPSNSQDNETDPVIIFANEGFCVTLIANELLMPKETNPMAADKEDALLDFMDEIYHAMKYSNLNQKSLASMLYAFNIGKKCT